MLFAEKMACKRPKIVKMSPEGIKTFSELLIRMIFTSDAGDNKKIPQMVVHTYVKVVYFQRVFSIWSHSHRLGTKLK